MSARARGLLLSDLSPEVQKQVKKRAGVKRAPRGDAFPKEQVRRHALRALAVIADLTQDQRRRVLEHAARLNRV